MGVLIDCWRRMLELHTDSLKKTHDISVQPALPLSALLLHRRTNANAMPCLRGQPSNSEDVGELRRQEAADTIMWKREIQRTEAPGLNARRRQIIELKWLECGGTSKSATWFHVDTELELFSDINSSSSVSIFAFPRLYESMCDLIILTQKSAICHVFSFQACGSNSHPSAMHLNPRQCM